MHIAADSMIQLLRDEARRNARRPLPARLWFAVSARWQDTIQRRVENEAMNIDHEGVAADVQMARHAR